MRLTSLDSLNRYLTEKNIVMYKLLVDFLSKNFYIINKNCALFLCRIFLSAY